MKRKQAHAAALCAALAAAPLTHGQQFTWNNPAGGSYSTAANWTPATVPDDPDTVLFNLGSVAGYTVNVDGNRDIGGFTVQNDHVTFNMDGANFSLGSAISPPLLVGTGGSANTAFLILQSASTDPSPDESVFNTGSTMIGSAGGAKGSLTVSSLAGPLFWNNHGSLTIGATGAPGSLLAINAGTTVTVDNTVSLFAGATLNINGGSLAMASFDRNTSGSTFIWTSGVIQITGATVVVDAAGIFGNGSSLVSGQELDAPAGLMITSAGTLQLSGGTLRAQSLVNSGTFAFNSGTLAIGSDDSPADVTIDAGGIFNSGNILSANKSLVVSGTTTINAARTLQLSGGTLNTGGLAIQPGGALTFGSGTLALTATDLTIGPGGLLGSAVTLNPGRNLLVVVPVVDVDPGTTTIAPGGTLLISGGSFATGRLTLAGGTFSFTSGTFSTFGAVSIDAAGMLGTSSTFPAGRNLNVSGAVIINPGGTLTLSGGSVIAGGLVNNGTIVFTSGTLDLNGDDLQIGPATPLGPAFSVNANMTLQTEGGSTLDLNPGGVLTLNGGTVNAAQLGFDGGQLVFNTGTLKLTNLAFLVDPNGPLGGTITLTAGQTIAAPLGVAITSGAHITLNGGKLSTTAITGSLAGLTFTKGEIDLATLTIGAGGLFGSSVTLPSAKALGMSDTTTINSGATLSLTGGALTTGSLINNGTLSFASGTLHISRDPVTIGAAGLFGLAPTISPGKTLIADTSLTVTGQTLTVSGGTVQAAILNLGQANSGNVLQSAGTVNVTGNLVIGAAPTFSATYNLSGSSTLSAATLQLTSTNGVFVQSGGTAAVTQLSIDSGGHVLSLAAGTFTAAFTLDNGSVSQSGGTFNGGFMTGVGTLQVSGAGIATADSLRLGGLSLASTARLTLNPSVGNNSTSALASLTITNSGTLDLNNTSMAFYSTNSAKGADYSTLLALVKSGRSSGTWTGTDITSSAAHSAYLAHGNAETTGLAVIRNDLLPVPYTTFAGVPVDANTILVKYTYVGDANLDGQINIDDYLALDNGFLRHLTGWQNGDFTDDGTINSNDYAAIDRVYSSQGGPLAAGLIAEHAAEFGAPYLEAMGLPEPGTLAILAWGGLMLLGKRRKTKAKTRK